MNLKFIMVSEIVKQRQIPYDLSYMWNLKTQNKQRTENKFVIARNVIWGGGLVGETGEGGQKANKKKGKQPQDLEGSVTLSRIIGE